MEKVITKDGSETFYSKEYREHYHSLSGAEEEAFEKHAKPAHIEEYAKIGKITIIDFCFGLGYNSAAAIDLALEQNPDCMIEIFGLENDEDLLNSLETLTPKFKSWPIIIDAVKHKAHNKNNIKLTLLVGDAREELDKIKKCVDIVFFDPFSPKKCPHLWTKEIFQKLYSLMNKGGRLTTYSCAKTVRTNLKEAGFKITDGPTIGRRAPSTIAIKE